MRFIHIWASLRPSGMEVMRVSAALSFAADELMAAGHRVRAIPGIKSITGYRTWMRLLREEESNAIHIHPEQTFTVSVLAARHAAPDWHIIRTIPNLFFTEGWWAVKRRAQAMAVDRSVDAFVALVAARNPAFHIADAVERNALGARLSRVEAAR